ncbi:hypothetical protein C1H46_035776 [Malus baccata]|uniref:Uncharacterized protein n=1 Tax=Malus baccata TaxID=106549 RepID=A0A540KWQ9_MALBA|nr:hypothetical protein C1H46_035776 [Malus baccata]
MHKHNNNAHAGQSRASVATINTKDSSIASAQHSGVQNGALVQPQLHGGFDTLVASMLPLPEKLPNCSKGSNCLRTPTMLAKGTAFGNMVVHEEVLRVIQTFRAPPLTLLSVSSSFLSLQVANMAESVELPTSLSILPFRNKVLLPSAIIRIRCTSPNRLRM